jgi:hypothetical protein
VACVSPAEDSAQESYSTLVFASGAKKIRNKVGPTLLWQCKDFIDRRWRPLKAVPLRVLQQSAVCVFGVLVRISRQQHVRVLS